MKETGRTEADAYRFDDVVVDFDCFCVVKGDRTRKITPRAFEVLLYLIDHRDRVVEKQELFDSIWRQSFVSDNALTRIIKEIRRALGDNADAPRYIETYPKRGYRFIAELSGKVEQAVAQVKDHDRRIASIAVLPFMNLSNDPDGEYLSDGIAETIISLLSQLPGLRVVPRSTAFRFKGEQHSPEEAGRSLGVRAVLTGRVLQRGKSLVVRAELMDVVEERQLWGEQYQRNLSDLFAIQTEIAQEISEKLRLKLTGEEKQQLARRWMDNVEAYQLYLKGRYFWGRRPGGLEKAIEYFRQAIEMEPGSPLAWAGLADCYSTLGSWENGSRPPREVMPKARAAVTRALEIDPALAEAHAALAYIKIHYDWDWAGAERECRLAIELNPKCAAAHHWYSHYLTATGRTEESLAESRQCLSHDPLDLILNNHMGWHYYFAHSYDEAVAYHQKTLELDPHSVWPYFELGRTYVQMGMNAEAIASFKEAVRISGSGFAIAGLGHAYALAGCENEAHEQLDELARRAERGYVSSYDFAIIHIGLGEKKTSLDLLERACEDRSGWMAYLKADPRIDSLRSEPRFTDLLRRVGLVQ